VKPARRRSERELWPLLALATLCAAACKDDPPPAPPPPLPQTIRCAVIGGMVETGFWGELSERYQRHSGHRVDLVAVGPKQVVVEAFRRGGVDLITFHSSDAMINLVADGLAADPQPWARNDFLLVGPAADPAKVRGGSDVVVALRAIIAAKAPILIHASLGADGVLHDALDAGHLQLAEAQLVPFADDSQVSMMAKAAAAGAYALVGRIPFVNGKIPHSGLVSMVEGDPALRRPYLVAVATPQAPSASSPAQLAAARDLARYLRSAETQAWIAQFGKGRFDARSLFFPVTLP
jgi:tungstate transport system substrate-binding protein